MSASFTILLVEDQEDDRELFRYAVERCDPVARLRYARDGDEAIAYLSAREPRESEGHPSPDLVVMDLNLPRVSGFEVLRWVRAQTDLQTLPVTILSSSAETRDIERAYALGANSYLVKASDLNAMYGVARGLCEHARILARSRQHAPK